MRRIAPVVGLVALGLALVAFFWMRTQRDVKVQLVHPEISAARWSAYLADIAKARRPTKQLAPVVAAFEAVNRAEVEADAAPGRLPHTDPDYVAAVAAFQEAAWQFTQRRTTAELLEFGRRRGLLLADRLDAFLGDCKARGVDPAESLRATTAPTRAYVAAGGVFVRFAQATGFVDGYALRAERLPMMQALFIHHWVSLLAPRIDLHDFVRADEREWLARWRLEFQTGTTISRRLEAADALRAVSGYPADLNAAALLYGAGRYVDAARRLEGLADPRAVAWRRMALRAAE